MTDVESIKYIDLLSCYVYKDDPETLGAYFFNGFNGTVSHEIKDIQNKFLASEHNPNRDTFLEAEILRLKDLEEQRSNYKKFQEEKQSLQQST